MNSCENDINNLLTDINNDVTKILSSHLLPLIGELKLSSSNLKIITDILYSLPEYKNLVKQLDEVNKENERLKNLLNKNNKSMEIKIIEKEKDNDIKFKEKGYNDTIKVENKIINSLDNINDSSSSEEDLDSNFSSEEEDLEENSHEVNQTKKIKFDSEKENIIEEKKNSTSVGIPSIWDPQADLLEEDEKEEEGKEEEEEEEVEGEEEEEEEGEEEEEEEGEEEEEEEEEEEVDELEINGKKYFGPVDKKNGNIYEYVEEDDDIGDKIGYYKEGKLYWLKDSKY